MTAQTSPIPDHMRAVVFNRYGPPEVLELVDLPVPVVGAGEVLVRVHAAAANPKDAFIRKGRFKMLMSRRFPRQVGSDFAGEVAAVGEGVTHVRPGDRVYGMIAGWRGGAYAEYVCVRAEEAAPMPEGLPFEQAAAVPLVALTALQALRDCGNIQARQHVFINGASGGVGTAAVQIATAYGAQVTGTCSAANADMVRELGAETVIDYTQADPLAQAQPCDIFFDVFGNYDYERARPLLRTRGVYVTTVPKVRNFAARAYSAFLGDTRAYVVVVRPSLLDMDRISRWISGGRLRPVVEQVYTLDQAQDVHRHIQTKHTRGKVVLRVI